MAPLCRRCPRCVAGRATSAGIWSARAPWCSLRCRRRHRIRRRLARIGARPCAGPAARLRGSAALPWSFCPLPVRSLSPAASAAAASDDEGARSRRARYHVRRQRDSAPVPPPRRLQVPPRLRPPCRRHRFRVPVGGCCLRVSRVGPPSSCSHSRTPRATTCRRSLHHRASRLPLYLLLRLVLRLELCLLLRPLLRRLRLRLLLRALPQRLMLRTRTFPSARPASAVAR